MPTTYSPHPGSSPRKQRAEAGLLMTDCMVIGAFFMASLWALDPARVGLDRLTVVKHLPMMALAGGLILVMLGEVLFPGPHPMTGRVHGERVHGVTRHLWPLTLFAAGVLLGSLYGRFIDGVDNSFMNMGLLLLVAPALAWFICKTHEPGRIAHAFFWALIAGSCIDGLLQWAHFAGETFYHGIEYAVIPLAVYCWFAFRSMMMRLLGALFFLSLAPAEHKNTGYMLAVLVVAYCGFWSFRERYKASRDGMARERQLGWAAFLASGLFAVGLSFYALRKLFLPTGNPEYRLHTYEKAFGKFLDSPIFGTLFSTPATERFELFQVNISHSNVLPTHSDPLDILANGGVLYSLLFIYGGWKVASLMYRALDGAKEGEMPELAAPLHACLAMMLSGIVVFSFNPVLTQPNAAFVFWAAIGLGVGLALRMRVPEPERKKRYVRGARVMPGHRFKSGPMGVPARAALMPRTPAGTGVR